VVLSTHRRRNTFAAWTFGGALHGADFGQAEPLFRGAPINTEFLPETLAHLPSHFRIARMNWVFPISVTG
jgi:putative photosynthetic complex assembly protein 2